MEIFGNQITGYSTAYYSKLIENFSKEGNIRIKENKEDYLENNSQKNNLLQNYQRDRGGQNNCSKISQKGLEIRAENIKVKEESKRKESFIQGLFKTKTKSKRWAKRQHNWDYTY
jgi:hypothetical protein